MTIQSAMKLLQNQIIGILGVGVEGRATIDYLTSHGIANIEALDKNRIDGLPNGVATTFGDTYLEDLDRFDVIFRSPGFRPDLPQLQQARQAGTRITSAISFFLENCPARVIGITGTVGKGTASSLTAVALEACGFTVHLGGNIGKSPLTFLDDVENDHLVVLELSSFQTMDVSASPELSCILKTTTEHLDWHLSTAEYREAKANLLAHQTPKSVVAYNSDSDGAKEIAAKGRGKHFAFSIETEVNQGLFLRENRFVLRVKGEDTVLPLDVHRVNLAGKFNLENIGAAILLAVLAGGDIEHVCSATAEFNGLPHRLQRITDDGNVVYYNDSYATRPDAAKAAISAFSEPLSLIMGGSEKKADFSELFTFIHGQPNIVSITLIGATAERMYRELTEVGKPAFLIQHAPDLPSAMTLARQTLSKGVLLMAPACASFGLFKNYKERGEQFVALAKKMAGNTVPD